MKKENKEYTKEEIDKNTIEIHPNFETEVGYYDISGEDRFRLYICKEPNFIQRFFTKFLLGWKYNKLTK